MAQFDIRTSISAMSDAVFEANKAKFATTTRGYILHLGAAAAMQFRDLFTMTVRTKEKTKANWSSELLFAPYDVVPDVVTTTWGTKTMKRSDIAELCSKLANHQDRVVLDHALLEEDVYYDRIVSIDEVPNNAGPWVYDLTVEGTRNFLSGVSLRDSFHATGASNKASVPRVKELVAVTKNPKTTTVHGQDAAGHGRVCGVRGRGEGSPAVHARARSGGAHADGVRERRAHVRYRLALARAGGDLRRRPRP